MAVIHVHGNEEQIKYIERILKEAQKEIYLKITDFQIALTKINSRDSFILPNFFKSQRYQIFCKTFQSKIPHITIIFGESKNPEAPNNKNKFDNPFLRVNDEFTEGEKDFIFKSLNRKILKQSKAHFREILDDDYLKRVNEIIEDCISELSDSSLDNKNYILNEVRHMFLNKIGVKKIDIENVKKCFLEMFKLELNKIS